MIVPVILSGGSGTKFLPVSRELYPKQLLKLVDDKTLLQNILLLFNQYKGIGDPVIICNVNHRFIVAEQFREIDIKPDSIIFETAGKNAALTVAVSAVNFSLEDKDPVLLILPSGRVINNFSGFLGALSGGEKELDFFHLDEKSFEACSVDSIHYAVMKKTNKGVMVEFQTDWKDIYSWEDLWQNGEKDENENVVQGDVMLHDVKSSFFNSSHRLITAIGVEDLYGR